MEKSVTNGAGASLATVTFVYAMQEDRILAVINAGRPDAWSCWVVLLLLERARVQNL